MTFRLQGPFPLDLQDVGASTRSAIASARVSMEDREFSTRLRSGEPDGATPGLYLLWDHPSGAGEKTPPALAGFWLTFGPGYVEGGPQEPLERFPPFADKLIEALTEEVWWQGLRVTPRDPKPRWRPLLVLEWPSLLADRASCPPPGEPAAEKAAAQVDAEPGGNWMELDDAIASPAPRNQPVDAGQRESGLPKKRSLIAVVQGDLHLEGTEHHAGFGLLHLSPVLPRDTHLIAMGTWLQHAQTGGTQPPDDSQQAPGAPLQLPGGRAGFALGGWLTAALEAYPLRPAAAEPHTLLGRDVGSRWKVQARQTATVVTSVVLLVLLVAAVVQEFTRPRAHAGPPMAPSEAQPALSVCSIDNDQFVEELRCQLKHLGEDTPLEERFCGDRPRNGESRTPTLRVQRDLQATWCGLRDRSQDDRLPFALPEEAGNDEIRVRQLPEHAGYADLAASKACYNVLQHPEDYRVDPAEPDHFHIPDPDRFLDDPVHEVKALGALVRDLDRACDALRPRLERQVEGAILARHVGAQAEPARKVDATLPEAAQLRQLALLKAAEALPPTERICLNDGAVQGPRGAETFGELCASGGVVPLATGPAWAALGPKPGAEPDAGTGEALPADPLDAALEAPGSDSTSATGDAVEDAIDKGADETLATDPLVDRYIASRFSPLTHPDLDQNRVIEGAPDLWKCHMVLTDPTLPMAASRGAGFIEGAQRIKWDLLAPVPKAYASRTVGAVTRQLELDAILSGLSDGANGDLGACWSVVARRLVRYQPVHPLLPEREMQSWPSEEQQLCAQVCAALYRVQDSPHRDRWFTKGSDLGRCIDRSGPKTLTQRNRRRAFAALKVPWNNARDNTWTEPYPFEICAFNLVAQDYLSGDAGEVIIDGLAAPEWAGETTDYRVEGRAGETSAGGLNLRKLGYDNPSQALPWVSSAPGGAWQAAMNLESYGRARSSSTCSHAATQCFTSQMLAAISSNPDQPHRWTAAWQTRLERLATGGTTADLDLALEASPAAKARARDQQSQSDGRGYGASRAQATPWCRLIQPYIAGDEGLPEGQLDFPCASGVEQTRQAVEATMLNLASRGRATAAETP